MILDICSLSYTPQLALQMVEKVSEVLKIGVFRLNSAKISKVVNLGGELAGAERLACICVVSWQERSDWLVFEWGVGRSRVTGLYLGGHLAGAERLACIWVVSWQEPSNRPVLGCAIGRSRAM